MASDHKEEITNIVHFFFEDELAQTDIDGEIVNYVTSSIIEEAQNEENFPSQTTIDLVHDVISGFVDSFNFLDNATQASLIIGLLHKVKDVLLTHQTATALNTLPVSQQDNIVVNDPEHDSCSNQHPTHVPDDDDENKDENSDIHHHALEFLASMCSRPPPAEYLNFVLSVRNKNNLEHAANELLTLAEQNTLGADIAQWEKKIESKSKTQMMQDLDDSLRKSIVNKFHLVTISQSDPASTTSASNQNRGIVAAWGEFLSSQKKKEFATMEKRSNIRYRDNMIVATKGEKYVIEKPPEWDGGSRGRVKSKRKGGKGWI